MVEAGRAAACVRGSLFKLWGHARPAVEEVLVDDADGCSEGRRGGLGKGRDWRGLLRAWRAERGIGARWSTSIIGTDGGRASAVVRLRGSRSCCCCSRFVVGSLRRERG